MKLLHSCEVSTPLRDRHGVKNEQLSVLDQILYGDADPEDDGDGFGDTEWRTLTDTNTAIKREQSLEPWRLPFDCAVITSASPIDPLTPGDALGDAAMLWMPGAEQLDAALADLKSLDDDAHSTQLLADLLRVDDEEDNDDEAAAFLGL